MGSSRKAIRIVGHHVWTVVASQLVSVMFGVVEVAQPPPNPRRLRLVEGELETFLHPHAAPFSGRVGRGIGGVQGSGETVPMLDREGVRAGRQQLPVDPHPVPGAAPAQPLPGDSLPDLGHHLVGQRDQVHFVDRDPQARPRSRSKSPLWT